MKLIACRLAGNILREEIVNGRRHIVVPVVAMVEGVHQGIVAPGQPAPRSFYSFSELSRSAASLAGVPVTLYHPMTDTELVSANSAVGQPFVIGQVHNVRAENNRLHAEAWLDVEQLTTKSPETLQGLNAGTSIDVSLGILSDVIKATGTWLSEIYDEIMTNIRFDHLALLPGISGACSWADGCGVRVNKGNIQTKKESDMKLSVFQKLTQLASRAMERLYNNEASHDDIRDKLYTWVNALDTPEYVNYLRECYDGYFIYETMRRNNMTGVTVATKLYKRSYTANADGQVSVADDAVEVTEKTEYVPVDSTTANVTLNQENAMKEQLIKDLIACDRTPFKEEHRTMLTGLSECDLKLLQADNFKPAVAPIVAAAAPGNAALAPAPVVTAPVANAPAPVVANAAPAKPETVEEYLAKAPVEVSEPIKRMMAREAAAKDAVIKKIIANQGCPFTEAELKLKDLGELQKIAALAKVPFDLTEDFTGQAGAPRAHEGPKVPLMPSTARLPVTAAAK